jgi:arsenite-transporting ATPase
MLTKNGELLFGNEDPGEIYYQGKAFEFLTESNSLQMKVKVPFTERDDFDLERYGDQLIIKVRSSVGYIVNIIPLPSVTLGMQLAKAKLHGDELNVMFEKSM